MPTKLSRIRNWTNAVSRERKRVVQTISCARFDKVSGRNERMLAKLCRGSKVGV